jgi:hypothetical protein
MKNVMELFKGDAVKFFGIDKKIVSAARTERLQIDIQKNIDDWKLLADDGTYIHFEFQSDYDKNDLSRFMVSDAMFYFKEKKPVQTIVVYSSDIKETETSVDAGSLRYDVQAFYMVKLDGDDSYSNIKAKVEAGDPLTKQDLMSIVFLPLMTNSVDKGTRLEQAIHLSMDVPDKNEQLQIQAMLGLLAEKFIKDDSRLEKIKELIGMYKIFEMLEKDIEDRVTADVTNRITAEVTNRVTADVTARVTPVIRASEKVLIAKNMLLEGEPFEKVMKYTGLSREEVENLSA